MRKTTEYAFTDYKTKYRDCKRTKYNPGYGKNIGI